MTGFAFDAFIHVNLMVHLDVGFGQNDKRWHVDRRCRFRRIAASRELRLIPTVTGLTGSRWHILVAGLTRQMTTEADLFSLCSYR